MKEDNVFSPDFDNNKSLLKNLETSKKIRNQIAGYITRVKKAEEKKIRINS